MSNVENQPFEASYEGAKQSIISFLGEVSRAYDIPIPLLNILIYEIALETRNASFSAIVGGCDISYPEQQSNGDIPKAVPNNPKVINKEDAIKNFTTMEEASGENDEAPADITA